MSKKRFVVSAYYTRSCHVGYATIAHFDVIFIADLMQAVMKRKVFGKQVKKNLTDASLYMLA